MSLAFSPLRRGGRLLRSTRVLPRSMATRCFPSLPPMVGGMLSHNFTIPPPLKPSATTLRTCPDLPPPIAISSLLDERRVLLPPGGLRWAGLPDVLHQWHSLEVATPRLPKFFVARFPSPSLPFSSLSSTRPLDALSSPYYLSFSLASGLRRPYLWSYGDVSSIPFSSTVSRRIAVLPPAFSDIPCIGRAFFYRSKVA